METAFDQLTEYLRLRRQAEEYYQSHHEMQALLNDLHTAAADKLTPDEGKRLNYEVPHREHGRKARETEARNVERLRSARENGILSDQIRWPQGFP